MEPGDPRQGLGRVAPPTRLQASLGRWPLIEVPARKASRTCGCCGAVDATSLIDRERFECRSCGHRANGDINAACEILRRDLHALGLTETPRPEPSWQPEQPSAPAPGDNPEAPPSSGESSPTALHASSKVRKRQSLTLIVTRTFKVFCGNPLAP
ncbi:zinc ribbon domain-containing protein [Paracoccus benzoatiresistens]|uniref:zinc ribbon domain-containing protein n=1 Tax=Paracoccus benzoatiresistens TaxID=2997341 RepID=UPI0035303A31